MNLTKLSAFSFKNGVCFRSPRVAGLAVEEYIENGEIKEKVYDYSYNINPDLVERFSKKNKILVYVLITSLILASFVMVFRYLRTTEYSTVVTLYLGFWMVVTVFYIAKLIAIFIIFFFTSEGRSVRRFHGAEHKVCNAWQKTFGYPTYRQIKESSKYDFNCSTRTYVYKILPNIAIIIAIIKLGDTIKFWQLVLVVIFVYNISSYIFLRTAIDMIFQWIFVGNPTETELEVAYKCVEGIKTAEEKYFEEHKDQIESFEILFRNYFS